ncbi:U6 snRNA phosphodiesterase 1-like [Ornithodoros turicata]|uniref:U6 snRNA phosphodiesterase 1-like n=1 Tax=Ornithodoros turicata TaxID=34597 RepID=UPI0031395633
MSDGGGLTLLATYQSSDSSGEEDSLSPPPNKARKVHPPSELQTKTPRASKVALPLPADVLNLYGDRIDPFGWEDDSSKHDGRVRAFAHGPGVWASYIYVPASSSQNLHGLIDRLCDGLDYLKPNNVESCHVSLSKTVKLQYHWIQPIAHRLREKLTPFSQFPLYLGSLEVYTNEEGTRTFLGLKALAGEKTLKDMVTEVDACLEEYELPTFYDPPSFHMSLAWCDAKHETTLERILPDLVVKMELYARRFPAVNMTYVNTICFRAGNKLFEFGLSSHVGTL